jgi:heme exporter protein C
MVTALAKGLLGVWMAAAIVLAFTTPDATKVGFDGSVVAWSTFRIVFFHVPAAWTCVIAFLVSMVYSVRVLRTGREDLDDRAMASAQIGFLFAALALVSGMIWAKADWGAFWNWDPRQSSVLILLLVYAGYFALRSAVDEPRKRSRLAAVYSIAAFLTVPFLIFVVPRIMFSLHPSPVIPDDQGGGMDNAKRVVLYTGVFGFLGLYVWMQSLRVRIAALARSAEEA